MLEVREPAIAVTVDDSSPSCRALRVVMFQFPSWFHVGEERRDYILSCKEKMGYIEIFYNRQRQHARLGFLSPAPTNRDSTRGNW